MSVRLLGLVPLLNFAYVFHFHASRGTLPELLWVCNVCSLLLGIGLLARWMTLVKTATVWLLVGAPLWAVEAARTDGWLAHSFVTHLLQPAIGIGVLRRFPARQRTWWIALAMLAVAQARCARPRRMCRRALGSRGRYRLGKAAVGAF